MYSARMRSGQNHGFGSGAEALAMKALSISQCSDSQCGLRAATSGPGPCEKRRLLGPTLTY